MLKPLIRLCLFSFIISSFFTSCEKEGNGNNKNIQFDKVIVKNEGECEFKDSLLFLVNDSRTYELKITTIPEDADLFYSSGSQKNYIRLAGNWLTIDSSFKTLRFYSSGQAYNSTDTHEIELGYEMDSIISDVKLYPNPFKNSMNFRFNTLNKRGTYEYTISDTSGTTIMTEKEFISDDVIEKSVNLSDQAEGIYSIRFDFGNSGVSSKIIVSD